MKHEGAPKGALVVSVLAADARSVRDAYEKLADAALDGCAGWAQGVINGVLIVAVSDLKIAEFAANGQAIPPTWQAVRPDGRSAYFYRGTS